MDTIDELKNEVFTLKNNITLKNIEYSNLAENMLIWQKKYFTLLHNMRTLREDNARIIALNKDNARIIALNKNLSDLKNSLL
jgi:hypothetical protein